MTKKRPIRKYYKYTDEEVEYIKDKFGVYTTEFIGKKLGRSTSAIKKKAGQIFGTTNPDNAQGYFSAESLGQILGVCSGKVTDWINNRGLPAITRGIPAKHGSNPSSYKIVRFSLDIDVFFEWLEDNKKNVKIDFNKVNIDELSFAPDWFLEDYKNKNHYRQESNTPWTQSEVNTLLHLFYNESKTMKEISTIMNRSERSIRNKKQRLNEKGVI